MNFYRMLLFCYPKPFRSEYGTEMLSAFRDQLLQARRNGNRAELIGLWFDTLVDLAATAPKEQIHVILQDLRYAARTLAATPAFAAVAILSLALGIGANLALFSLLDSVLLSPLPVRNPQELVMLTDPAAAGTGIGSTNGERALLSYPEFLEQRASTAIYASLMAVESTADKLPVRVEGGEPEDVRARMVSGEYFSTLGVAAHIGRTLSDLDSNRIGAAPYAMLSYDFWQRRFAGAPEAVGTVLKLRGGVFTIVGVAPESFHGETIGQTPDLWLPLAMQPIVKPGRDYLRDEPGRVDKVMWLHVFGRLQPGQTKDSAQAQANAIFQQGLARFYGTDIAPEVRRNFLDQRIVFHAAATGASQIRGQFAEPLWILLAAAGLILLIACANLGNLLLARVVARNREISVRLALGASRGRLVRQLLTETLFLAALGGVAGVGAAMLMRIGLVHLVSDTLSLPLESDWRLLGFAFALTLLTGLLLGLLPALRASQIDSGAGIKEQGRANAGSLGWQRAGRVIVIAQLALSLPLLVGAGLFLQTLENLQHVELGYAKDRLLAFTVDARTAGYEEARRLPLFTALTERIRAVPGVVGVTYSDNGIFSGSDSGDELIVEGYTPKGTQKASSSWDQIGPGYFSTLGVSILQGREIDTRDTPSSAKVCVVNENFAKEYFAGKSPLGKKVTQVFGNQRNSFEVVGVARNLRVRRLRGDIERRLYVPAAQPIEALAGARYSIVTAGSPGALIPAIRRAILARDANLPITEARAVKEMIDDRMTTDRLVARLSLAFGAVALLLAAIGLYGILAYGVTRRTNEIGIRKALGAQQGAVIGMILKETGWLLLVGLSLGWLLSYAAMQSITSRLYGLAPGDPLVFTLAILTLGAVALVATVLPAYRAARVDPLVALRHD